jgi:hypothetical protein
MKYEYTAMTGVTCLLVLIQAAEIVYEVAFHTAPIQVLIFRLPNCKRFSFHLALCR